MGPFQPGVSLGLGIAHAAHGPYMVRRDIHPLTARDKGGNNSAQRDFGPVKGLSVIRPVDACAKLSAS